MELILFCVFLCVALLGGRYIRMWLASMAAQHCASCMRDLESVARQKPQLRSLIESDYKRRKLSKGLEKWMIGFVEVRHPYGLPHRSQIDEKHHK